MRRPNSLVRKCCTKVSEKFSGTQMKVWLSIWGRCRTDCCLCQVSKSEKEPMGIEIKVEKKRKWEGVYIIPSWGVLNQLLVSKCKDFNRGNEETAMPLSCCIYDI